MPLTRPLQQMPPEIALALEAEGLNAAYAARPAHQRNDYVRWINNGARPETRAKRLAQMMDELKRGDVYMRMAWRVR